MNDAPDNLAELLPFYVSGALSAADKTRVEAALAADPALREELEEVRALARLVREGGRVFVPGDSDARLAALMGRLDRSEGPGARFTPEAPAARRDRRTPAPVAGMRRRSGNGLRLALLAASLMVVAEAGVIAVQFRSPQTYEALGEAAAPAPRAGPRLLVKFAPEAPWADIEALLADQKLAIVAGPRGGVVEAAVQDKADSDQAMAGLRASPLVVFVAVAE